MMRRDLIAAMVATLFVAMAGPAAATPPSDVHIEVATDLAGAPSPFVASGPAVDIGFICSAGDVISASINLTGFTPNGFNFHGIKNFICEDGSGEFLVNLQARIDFRKGTTLQWNVISGTGDYQALRGAGSGVGLDLCGPDCVLDIYEGGLHID